MTFSVGPVSDSISAWIASFGVPATLAEIVSVLLVCCGPVLGIAFPIAGVAQYFERKIAAAMQRRKGPMVGATGVVQLVIDLAFFWQPRWKRQATVRKLEKAPVIG